MSDKIWIDKSALPKKKSQIDWKNAVGTKIPFQYNDHKGELLIREWKPGELIIQYGDIVAPITIRSFNQAKLGRALKFRNYDWIYEVGTIYVCDDGNEYEIIERKIDETPMSRSSRFYNMKCRTCGESTWFFENEIGKSCPVCNNRAIIQGKNDLWTTHERIARQLLNPKDGYTCTIGKLVYFDWKCPICGEICKHLTPMQVKNTIDSLVPCPSCSDGYSYPNKFMFNLLTSLNIDFYNEKNFKWSGLGRRKYDFYLPQYSMIIEMHGEQHYVGSNLYDLKKIQKNDDEKKKIALDNSIKEYIVIDSSVSKPEFIFSNIMKSRLPLFLDFESVDIQEIDRRASQRVRQRTFEVLEEVNYDFVKAASIMKINRCTVSKYVNNAIKKGLIDETIVREAQRINKIKQHYQIDGQPIHCLELDVYFGSGRELREYFEKELGNGKVSLGTIVSQAIKGNCKAYGFNLGKNKSRIV